MGLMDVEFTDIGYTCSLSRGRVRRMHLFDFKIRTGRSFSFLSHCISMNDRVGLGRRVFLYGDPLYRLAP
jgi:hypothetical protein